MERPAKRTKLLSDGESDSDNAPTQPSNANRQPTNGFKVNTEYAQRFEHNKKREEKHRLEEKYGTTSQSASMNGRDERNEDGSEDSSSDESEDDDAELATKDVDDEIMATLNAIRQKHPRVYQPDVKFYKEFEADAEGGGEKKEKPMYLKDYHRQNLLAGHTGVEDDDEAGGVPTTYQQEQDRMKKELVGSMHTAANGAQEDSGDDEGADDFLVAKARPKHADIPASNKARQITDADVAEADRDPETYLSNFMAARAWLPTESSQWQAFDSDDSEDDRRAGMFEDAYNMRFEDPKTANEKLQSFARDVGKHSVRRDENKSARQRTRDREREKKEADKRERDEEKGRLRKLKIEEAEEKVRRIKEAAGIGKGQDLNIDEWKGVLEGDFDDDKWEAEMRRRFGDDYYATREGQDDMDESDEGEGEKSKRRKLHKPRWEDDIDIKDLVPDWKDEERPDITLSDDEGAAVGGLPVNVDDDGADAMDVDEPVTASKKHKTKKDRTKDKADAKRAARRERRQIEDLVDSNLPIATTSASASAPVGFRYRETSPTTFGLSAKDILFADDAQLNQFAGLKKLAAWREDDKKRKDRKRFSKKQRLREWRSETFGNREGPVVEDKQQAETKDATEGKKRKRSKKGKGVNGMPEADGGVKV